MAPVYEVELKTRTDHGPVRRRLNEQGATYKSAVTQRDIYYDAPHRDFAATDEALRVREEHEDESETTRLTYKGPLVDESSKTREEHETEVDAAAALRDILDGLGFEPAAVVQKERTFYALNGYTVVLDTVSELGEFVEVETEVSEETDVPAARDGARDLLAVLGLDPDDTIRTSYLGLLLADK